MDPTSPNNYSSLVLTAAISAIVTGGIVGVVMNHNMQKEIEEHRDLNRYLAVEYNQAIENRQKDNAQSSGDLFAAQLKVQQLEQQIAVQQALDLLEETSGELPENIAGVSVSNGNVYLNFDDGTDELIAEAVPVYTEDGSDNLQSVTYETAELSFDGTMVLIQGTGYEGSRIKVYHIASSQLFDAAGGYLEGAASWISDNTIDVGDGQMRSVDPRVPWIIATVIN